MGGTGLLPAAGAAGGLRRLHHLHGSSWAPPQVSTGVAMGFSGGGASRQQQEASRGIEDAVAEMSRDADKDADRSSDSQQKQAVGGSSKP